MDSLQDEQGFLYVMVGRSMFPVLRELDVLEVSRQRGYRRGDIILFDDPKARLLVAHRIIGRRGRRIATRGDQTPRHDRAAIDGAQILGRVIGRGRGEGHARVWGGVAGVIEGEAVWCAFRLLSTARRLLRVMAGLPARCAGRNQSIGVRRIARTVDPQRIP